MGYITSFNLYGYNSEEDLLAGRDMPHSHLEKIFDWIKNNTSSDMKFEWLDDAKWYDWDEDMTALSNAYPDVIFELFGDGEETDDIWKAIFYNGKMKQVTQTTYFPAINLSELGINDPNDTTAPNPEPENAYFFAKE